MATKNKSKKSASFKYACTGYLKDVKHADLVTIVQQLDAEQDLLRVMKRRQQTSTAHRVNKATRAEMCHVIDEKRKSMDARTFLLLLGPVLVTMLFGALTWVNLRRASPKQVERALVKYDANPLKNRAGFSRQLEAVANKEMKFTPEHFALPARRSKMYVDVLNTSSERIKELDLRIVEQQNDLARKLARLRDQEVADNAQRMQQVVQPYTNPSVKKKKKNIFERRREYVEHRENERAKVDKVRSAHNDAVESLIDQRNDETEVMSDTLEQASNEESANAVEQTITQYQPMPARRNQSQSGQEEPSVRSAIFNAITARHSFVPVDKHPRREVREEQMPQSPPTRRNEIKPTAPAPPHSVHEIDQGYNSDDNQSTASLRTFGLANLFKTPSPGQHGYGPPGEKSVYAIVQGYNKEGNGYRNLGKNPLAQTPAPFPTFPSVPIHPISQEQFGNSNIRTNQYGNVGKNVYEDNGFSGDVSVSEDIQLQRPAKKQDNK